MRHFGIEIRNTVTGVYHESTHERTRRVIRGLQ